MNERGIAQEKGTGLEVIIMRIMMTGCKGGGRRMSNGLFPVMSVGRPTGGKAKEKRKHLLGPKYLNYMINDVEDDELLEDILNDSKPPPPPY